MNYYVVGNELYHHGIKGQKWGVRKYQNEDGTWTEAGKKRYGTSSDGTVYKKSFKTKRLEKKYEYNKQAVKDMAQLKGGVKDKNGRDILTDRDVKDLTSGYRIKRNEYQQKLDVSKQKDIARQKAKDKKEADKRDAVKKYSKLYDKEMNLRDKSDDMFRDAKAQYKALGDNVFQRAKAVSAAQKGKGSAAAKKYIETWDKASELGDKAYDLSIERRAAYKDTGRTYLGRVVNNIKYDRDN